ncbi:hypothetical protein [Micromonospora sp. WMMD708]|uniref:hypothetical protein n=1 Tax=Micromonospora sp. WMMD708 TaxID=3403464 RepID=UPI003BF5775C
MATALRYHAALHYYVVHDGAGEPEGLLAEEFLLGADHSCVGLVGGGWSRSERRWHDASATSRRLRVDPALRARVTPVSRDGAATLYREFCGTALPDEAALRTCFGAPSAPPSPPLSLHRPEATPGFRETRTYRILFPARWPRVGSRCSARRGRCRSPAISRIPGYASWARCAVRSAGTPSAGNCAASPRAPRGDWT